MTLRLPCPTSPSLALSLAAASAIALLGPGCLKSREEPAQGSQSCAGNCHGASASPAPPFDTKGNSATSAPGVGAHQLHLTGGPTHQAVSCDTCHVVPRTVNEPGHIDHPPPATLHFTGVASAMGRQPYYDPATHTCVDTYCHSGPAGSAWPGQAVWNQPRPSDQACGSSCHSLPPGGSHPQVDRCELCHTTAGPNHSIRTPAQHINGQIEVSASGACNSCHGDPGRPGMAGFAPPKDTSGNSDTTVVTVGAHQQHLAASSTYLPPVTCDNCHVVPATVDAPGHLDAPPAELTFGGSAVAGGVKPVWDRDNATCTNVYCHGATLTGGTAQAPMWTKVDGTQGSCGACHGVPPPDPHPKADMSQCGYCHVGAMDASGMPSLSTHVNGQIEFYTGTACNACHGNAENAAPPKSLAGKTDTTDPAVGAHQLHLKGGTYQKQVPCGTCHVVPASVWDDGHMSGLPANVTFADVATANGSQPAWDHTARTCTGTWCHGKTDWTGSNPTPVWNAPGTVQCGSCHALPPGGNHPPIGSAACDACHASVVKGITIIDTEKHINGQVDY